MNLPLQGGGAKRFWGVVVFRASSLGPVWPFSFQRLLRTCLR